MTTIPEIMIEEHERINRDIKALQSKINDIEQNSSKEDVRKLLDNFFKIKWNIEKHFFVEEKVIFTIYLSQRDEAENNDINHIVKEHKEILEMLEEIEDNLQDGIKPNLNDLLEILATHEDQEDNHLYPKFEEELDEKQKQLIRERANEILRK